MSDSDALTGLVGLLQLARIDFDAGGRPTAEEPRPKEKKSFGSKLFG
ncbi:hypothetical protein [Myxococcus fulvus]|nr:hypothetical protein [Myxococcus fulvus]MCK8503214.1 hypothetical protein [Myxococcus fulvus]